MTTLCLAGDVMTGRGVDQVLSHPGEPELRESAIHDARDYVDLAELRNGPIPRAVDPSWPWGDALARPATDARVINLETAVTRHSAFAPGKAVHYRMTPENLSAVLAGEPDVCVLANNHVLDFGSEGLTDTLDAFAATGVAVAGAGRSIDDACRPAAVPLAAGGRLVVHAAACGSSGVPRSWAAGPDRPGVWRLPDPTAMPTTELVDRLAEHVLRHRRPGDVTVFSVHWGSNWGYDVPDDQVELAHGLVAAGVDIVHGHSSHHPRPIEVHDGRLVLYGCGDLINDYEGITGYEQYRPDLRLLYLATVERESGELLALRLAPFWAARLRLHSAAGHDVDWLARALTRASSRFGTRVTGAPDGQLEVMWD